MKFKCSMFCSISLATSHLFNIDSSQLSPKALRPFRCAISRIDFLRWQWQDNKEEKWSEHRSRATGSNRDWREPHIVELQKGIRQAMQGRDARQYKARCHQMRNANASFFATVWLHTLSRLVVIESELRVVARASFQQWLVLLLELLWP